MVGLEELNREQEMGETGASSSKFRRQNISPSRIGIAMRLRNQREEQKEYNLGSHTTTSIIPDNINNVDQENPEAPPPAPP